MVAGYIPDYESDRKYAGMRFDVIIPVNPAAIDFMQTEGWSLFSGVPLVACAIARSAAEMLEHSPVRSFSSGVIIGDNARGVITSALRRKAGYPARRALIVGTCTNDL